MSSEQAEDTPARWVRVLIGLGQAAVLTLIGANIYSIHKFRWTVIGWPSLLVLPLCMAVLSALILGALAFAHRHEARGEDDPGLMEFAVKMPLGVGLGSLLLMGCIPFWVNTWSTSGAIDLDVLVTESVEATVTWEDGTALGEEIHVGTDHVFEYGGHSFEVFDSSDGTPHLAGKLYRGWLGWEFIEMD